MPINYSEFTRRPGVDRNELALGALNFCRTLRRAQDEVENARYFWIDWNKIAVLVEGGAGINSAPSGGPQSVHVNPDARGLWQAQRKRGRAWGVG